MQPRGEPAILSQCFDNLGCTTMYAETNSSDIEFLYSRKYCDIYLHISAAPRPGAVDDSDAASPGVDPDHLMLFGTAPPTLLPKIVVFE